MKTLIELYDERPLENVLGTEMFRPERTVFICPPEVAQNATLKRQLRAYFDSLAGAVSKQRMMDDNPTMSQLAQISLEDIKAVIRINYSIETTWIPVG